MLHGGAFRSGDFKRSSGRFREFKDREEEREHEQAEPWALRHRSAATDSPSVATEGGYPSVPAGGGQVVEFLPSAASMQEECCKMCESCGTGVTLWLMAFSFDRREVVESLSRAQKQGANTLLVLDRKRTLQGPAEQQRVALQAAGARQRRLVGRAIRARRPRAYPDLYWHSDGQRLDVLAGSASFTTSSRANRGWAFKL